MTDLQIRPVDQMLRDTHTATVDGSPTPPPATAATTPMDCPLVVDPPQMPANVAAIPSGDPLASDILDPGQAPDATHRPTAGVDSSAATSQRRFDTQNPSAGGGTPSTPANVVTTPPLPPPGSTLPEPPAHSGSDTQVTSDGWLELRIWAEMFNDAQLQRIATNNRAERGGVDPAIYAPAAESVTAAEAVVKRQLTLSYRVNVPKAIRDWQKATLGLGEPLMARLLGHLGHPVIATPHHWEGTGTKRTLVADEPYARTVGQLWQYCGHGRPGRPKKGATAEDLAALGSPDLKMLVHLNAEAMVKAGIRKNGDDVPPGFDPETRHAISAFGQVYLDRRTTTWAKTHTAECVRCGPSGKPAQPGTPWSPGHQQGDALRFVGKEMLRDLWSVAQ